MQPPPNLVAQSELCLWKPPCAHWEQLLWLAMTLNAHVSRQPSDPSCSPVSMNGFSCRWLYSFSTQMNSWKDLWLSWIADGFILYYGPQQSHALYASLLTVLNEKARVLLKAAGFSHSHRGTVSESKSSVLFGVTGSFSICLAIRRRLMWMAAIQRTLHGGERVATVWLHDA